MAGPRPTRSTSSSSTRSKFTATFDATLVPGVFGIGVEFCGTKGRLYVDRHQFTFYPVKAQPVRVTGEGDEMRDDPLTFAHVRNFLDCMKTRKLPNGDVLAGHRSAQASHLGNIAYVQKRRIDFDPIREEIQPF